MALTWDDVLAEWQGVMEMFQRFSPIRYGLLGDGNGTVNVSSRPGWSWIRYNEDQSKLSQVRNYHVTYATDGTPVIVGKQHPTDEFEQVLGIALDLYGQSLTEQIIVNYASVPHGENHHGTYGSDPAHIDLNNIMVGRVAITDPPTMSVYVYSFYYPKGLTLEVSAGRAIDLTAHIPVGAGNHNYVMVYLELDSGDLSSVASDEVPAAVDPTIPTAPELCIPLGVVELEQGMTSIEDKVWQYKLLWGSVGNIMTNHTHSSDTQGGDSIVNLGELMFACAEPLYLVGNAIWPVNTYHKLYIPSSYLGFPETTADLAWIHPDPAYGCGQILIIRPASPAIYTDYSIRLLHGAGNIWLSTGQDVKLESATDHIMLIYNGTYWCDVAGLNLALEADEVRFGKVTDFDESVPGYGTKVYFSGGPSWGVWDSDNSDPLWIARWNEAVDQSRLRVNIGDNSGSEDRFTVGYTSGGVWYPAFSVFTDGTVILLQNAEPADAVIPTSGFTFWLDDTPGAAILNIKAKDSNGTVVTGTVNLT